MMIFFLKHDDFLLKKHVINKNNVFIKKNSSRNIFFSLYYLNLLNSYKYLF
jgi:hypothetical protein